MNPTPPQPPKKTSRLSAPSGLPKNPHLRPEGRISQEPTPEEREMMRKLEEGARIMLENPLTSDLFNGTIAEEVEVLKAQALDALVTAKTTEDLWKAQGKALAAERIALFVNKIKTMAANARQKPNT